ncbi:hypothetical protein Vretifemale_14870 [Volvox reticuliferus]|uniref:Uncharacterized protein n=1 Tax=Volvox reticuliferus TaxID=1737510 RepID=A0A8J4CWA7_9CHLO|nr:hypothetical protein Vretifemale_14870 [Volvox reticuliferus]
MSEHPLEDLDGIWSSEEEDEQDVQPEDVPIAGNVVDEITWQRTPQGTELLRIISALIEMPTSNEDVQRLAGHVHNVLHLTAQGFIKLLKGVLARCEATKSDPCMRLQETFGRVSNPCLYTVLLGGFAELQQRQRERGRAAGASESLTAGDGELPPDGGPHTRKCGFPNELDKLLRKSDVDLVIREFSLKMYQERRCWAQVHIKGDEDSKQRVSRVLKNIMATMGIDREAHQKMDKTVRLQLHDRIYKKIRTCMHRIYLQSKLPKWFEDTCESHGIEMWHLNEGISSGMKDGLTEVDIMDNIVTATGVEAIAERQQQLQGHEHQYGGRWCQDRDNHDSDIRSKSKQRHLHIRSQQPGHRCTYGRAAGNDQSQVRGAQLAAHQNRCNPDAPSTSRGEAGAAARAPEDRRRSGRGTVGSQYDLPQHIAPAGMVETMERGPQPPPPPQQTHGNRVGGAQLAAHQNRCNPDAPSTSRGEAGAAARAPEDRRRSGRGTVGSQVCK